MPRKDVHVLLLCCSFLYQNKDNMNMIYTHPQTHSYTTAYTSSMYILEICTHYLPLHRICKQVKESDELRSLWRTWDGSWKQKNMQQMSCRPVQVKVSVRSLRICVLLPSSSLFIAASCSSCLFLFWTVLVLAAEAELTSEMRELRDRCHEQDTSVVRWHEMQQWSCRACRSDGVMLPRSSPDRAKPWGCWRSALRMHAVQLQLSFRMQQQNVPCPSLRKNQRRVAEKVKRCERSKMNWTKNRRGRENQFQIRQIDVQRSFWGAALRGELMSEESQRQKLQAETEAIAAV